MKWERGLDVASDDPPDEALSCRRRAWRVPQVCSECAICSKFTIENVVIHYCKKCTEWLLFVLIYYLLSSESLCVVNSLTE